MLRLTAILAAGHAAGRLPFSPASAPGPLGRRLAPNGLDRPIVQVDLSAPHPLNHRLRQRAPTRPLVTLTAELDHLEAIRSLLLPEAGASAAA
jgi:hypothetical protein